MTTTTNLIDLMKLADAYAGTAIGDRQEAEKRRTTLEAALEAQAKQIVAVETTLNGMSQALRESDSELSLARGQIEALQAEVLELRSQLDSID